MASATLSPAPPVAASTSQRRQAGVVGPDAFFQPMRLASRAATRLSASNHAVHRRVQVRASMKEKAITGLTAAALTAALLVVPDIAEAAQPGFSPSLKNFLLSIVSGGVVLTVLSGAVIAVANFDPVKRS